MDHNKPWDNAPLAERMRPRNVDEFIGQRHLLGEKKILRRLLEEKFLPSLILWGPPGCGKTTLAKILATHTDALYLAFSAVLSGVKEVREVVEIGRERKKTGGNTIVFVDEIHRFNKAQQDAFLPHVESGIMTLIGATTENPSFQVIAPLLSRCQVVVLHPLSIGDLEAILMAALRDHSRGLGKLNLRIEPEAQTHLASVADGDARRALCLLEVAASTTHHDQAGDSGTITLADVQQALERHTLRYDTGGEEHYNLISALHKSLRDSDPDACVYWLARMLKSGEDPLYIARRLIRFASEDIGNADPQALALALDARESYHILGSPEGDLALIQAAIYLATAPKSNAAYVAHGKALADIDRHGSLPVPIHIRNAPTRLMRELGYGKGYQYAHDDREALVVQEHLPAELVGTVYYEPTNRGHEAVIKSRLEKWKAILSQRRKRQ